MTAIYAWRNYRRGVHTGIFRDRVLERHGQVTALCHDLNDIIRSYNDIRYRLLSKMLITEGSRYASLHQKLGHVVTNRIADFRLPGPSKFKILVEHVGTIYRQVVCLYFSL